MSLDYYQITTLYQITTEVQFDLTNVSDQVSTIPMSSFTESRSLSFDKETMTQVLFM